MQLPPFRIRIVPRTLRFKQPAGTSRGIYYDRRVWYIVISSDSPHLRFCGVGECAPLHDLSCDFDEHYEERLHRICKETEQTQQIDAEALRPYPSVLFGLQTAFRSAAGSLGGDYLRLFPSAFTQGEQSIPINGLVWMGSFEEMCGRMEEKLEKGFKCVKLKIGAIDFGSELELIRSLRRRYGPDTVELRVDANGAFLPEEAMGKLEQLAAFHIHSIEQPIRQGAWNDMARLCAATPLPIALDEELIGIHQPEEKKALLDAIRPQYIILKPSLHGAFTGAAEWIALARERGIGYWVTSALESNIGLNAIAQWCASLSSDKSLPQGLGTGQLFEQNYPVPLSLEGDRLWFGTPGQRRFLRETADFKASWADASPTLRVSTSGSTGKPKVMEVEKEKMRNSAAATIQALGLQMGATALLCMPLRFIAGKMMLVRAALTALNVKAVVPSSHPFAGLHDAPDFAALTPMQAYESLRVPHERSLLRRTRCLIIGGGAISADLEQELRSFPHAVWSTYGMTETLSHIALRRVNGPEASDAYRPLPGVEVSLSPEGTLVIFAPAVHSHRLLTNDMAELLPDGSFRIIGRRDNVICSGGIKLQIEAIEQRLAPLGVPCLITSSPDARLGEAVTLLYEAEHDLGDFLKEKCRTLLDRYEVPRRYFRVSRLPLTETGKAARAEARRMAAELSGTL